MPRRARVSWAGWVAAAGAAPVATWLTMMAGVFVAAGSGVSDTEVGPVLLVLALFLVFGTIVAVFAGTLGAGLVLWPFLLAAETISLERPALRARAIVTCAALAGTIPVALGIGLAPYDSLAAKVVTYGTGTWLWVGAFRNQSGPLLGDILMVLAPILGGMAAGLVYNAMTQSEPEGLTEPTPGAI